MTQPEQRPRDYGCLKAIATDVHFWVPVVVLLLGLTLLLALR